MTAAMPVRKQYGQFPTAGLPAHSSARWIGTLLPVLFTSLIEPKEEDLSL